MTFSDTAKSAKGLIVIDLQVLKSIKVPILVQTEILTEMYKGHPYLITTLFEIRPVAYFGPKEGTFDQKTLSFLHQYGVTF